MKELLAELELLQASIARCCDIARQNNDSELFFALRKLHWSACDIFCTVEDQLASVPPSPRAEVS